MAKNDNIIDFLGDVADAIREKKETTEPIAAQDFADEIKSIKTAGMRYFDVRGFDSSDNATINTVWNTVESEWQVLDSATCFVKYYDYYNKSWNIGPRHKSDYFDYRLVAIGISLDKVIVYDNSYEEFDNTIEFLKWKYPNYDFEARFPEITEEEFYDLTWEAPEDTGSNIPT